jgi:hypothetical protein
MLVKQLLIKHVRRGEWLDLTHGPGELLDEAAMRLWDDARTCPAEVIRDILRGRLVADPDPHGVRLRGARISGRLDLEDLTTDVNLELRDCFLPEGVLARGARLAAVVLTRCQLEHHADPPLDAARLTCSVLDLSGARITGHATAGAVNLHGAHIDGSLDCDGACLRNDSGPALSAEGLQVGQAIHFRERFTATRTVQGVSPPAARTGAVRLTGARIGGGLDCTGATLHSDAGPALSAEGLQAGLVVFSGGFTATGTTDAEAIHLADIGAIHLAGAHIGSLECYGQVRLCNDSGPALSAEGLLVEQSIVLYHGFRATGAHTYGAVYLRGAHIGGNLDCRGAQLLNESGPALSATGVQVGQTVFLSKGFTAKAASGYGTVYLPGARIGGSLDCDGAWLTNKSGPALRAEGLQVGQTMFLSGGFDATGADARGAVHLSGAHIVGSLECDGARLCNKSGPALYANRLQVDQVINLRKAFAHSGGERDPDTDDLGAVNLSGARIGGSLHCDGAALRNDCGSALLADSLQTGRGIYLRDGFTATSGGNGEAVNLVRAQVGGKLFFDQAGPHADDPGRRLAVDGLTYSGVPEPISAKDWLCLLRYGTQRFAAQPYQELAAGYRALGDDRQARQILMAQRDDEFARAQPRPRWSERLWGKITKYTLGYGYKPWRALWGLATVVVVSCILAVVLGSGGALAQTSKKATDGPPCTVIQKVSVGLDLNLPVGTSLARAGCDITKNPGSATAAWLAAVGWVLRLLAWVFAALFIAGFTSAVRKT